MFFAVADLLEEFCNNEPLFIPLQFAFYHAYFVINRNCPMETFPHPNASFDKKKSEMVTVWA